MKADTKDRREASGLALPVSVGVHVVLVLLLIFGLPFPELQTPEQEQAIAVELVPPPEETEQAQAEPPPPPPAPEQPKPENAEPEPEPPPAEQAAQQPPPPAVLQPVFRFGEQEDGERVTAGDAAEEGTPAEEEEAQQAEPQKPEAPVQPETLAAQQAEQLAAQSEQQEAEPPTPTPKPELEPAPQATEPPAAEDAGRAASRAETGVTIATTAMNDLPRGVRAGRLCVTALRERMLNSVPPYFPDLLPSFRLDEGTVLDAPRAAFRMGGEWYGLSYRCEIDKDATRVRSFAFEVSGRLSEAERRRRSLPLR